MDHPGAAAWPHVSATSLSLIKKAIEERARGLNGILARVRELKSTIFIFVPHIYKLVSVNIVENKQI